MVGGISQSKEDNNRGEGNFTKKGNQNNVNDMRKGQAAMIVATKAIGVKTNDVAI